MSKKRNLKVKVKMEAVIDFGQEELNYYNTLTEEQRKEKIESLRLEFIEQVKSKVFMKEDFNIKASVRVV